MSYGNVISIQFTFFPSFGYWGQFRSLIYTACIICSFFLYACIFVYNGERAIQLIIRNRWNLYSKKPGCGRCWLQGSVYFGKKKKKGTKCLCWALYQPQLTKALNSPYRSRWLGESAIAEVSTLERGTPIWGQCDSCWPHPKSDRLSPIQFKISSIPVQQASNSLLILLQIVAEAIQ